MDIPKALELLESYLDEIQHLRSLSYRNDESSLWKNKVNVVLKAAFGEKNEEYRWLNPSFGFTVLGLSESEQQADYLRDLKYYETGIKKVLQKYQILGIPSVPEKELTRPLDVDKQIPLSAASPTAFIAHEGETEQLQKIREFLDALSIKYFIAEAGASDGRSIEGQVNWTQVKADFAICLATKGKAVNKETGKYYMGLNVADELGRARAIYKNKIILLVEDGVEVHTNTREIVYATFSNQIMDAAFVKIIKELRNWGFIQVEKR